MKFWFLIFLRITMILCTKGDDALDHKIVGGIEAIPGEYPYLVTVKTFKQFCAGSLISSSWVLTAAHCAQERPFQYTIKAGVHNLQKSNPYEQIRGVSRIYVYPYYSTAIGNYDIALMKLSRPVTITDYVLPIALPSKDFEPIGDGTVAGWGVEDEYNPVQTKTLREVIIPIVDNAECRNFYDAQKSPSPIQIYDSVMCGGGFGQSPCFGDSGGAFACSSSTLSYSKGIVACGIVSTGIKCGEMSVFTRVSYFRDWIQSVTGI